MLGNQGGRRDVLWTLEFNNTVYDGGAIIDLTRVTLVKILQGNPPKNTNPVFARVNQNINTVVANYANRVPLDYLRGIAHNIKV